MTKKEFKGLKRGDKIIHTNTRKVSVLASGYVPIPSRNYHGYFHREERSKGGWNIISELNYTYYEKYEEA